METERIVLEKILEAQRTAFLKDPDPSLSIRRDRLSRAIAMIQHFKPRIIEALDADFGSRARAVSLIADVLNPLTALKDARRKAGRWMKAERRAPERPLGLLGVRAWVEFQPLGVIGVMAPWNAPVALSLTPLAGILAAGNRAMIKPSELAPNVAALLAEMIGGAFAVEEVAVVQGAVETARSFAGLPFDHLLYTGGGTIARDVMRAAAAHLTPVTLELGGKSPAIVAADADIAGAAAEIVAGKLSNAGQICICPDHVWVSAERFDAFVAAAEAAARRMFPGIAGNPDVTATLGERARHRIVDAIEEAQSGGARVIAIGDADPARPDILVPHLVMEPPKGSALDCDEVFGPVLPIFRYDDLATLIDGLNRRATPLALYFFGSVAADIELIRRRARAGGVTLGGVMLHPFMQDLPFGGLGGSGMGRYIGRDGFKTFSHHKAMLRRGWVDIGRYLHPPYHPRMTRLLEFATRTRARGGVS